MKLCDSEGSHFELSRTVLARLQAATAGPVQDDDYDPGLVVTPNIAKLESFVANANAVSGLARPSWLAAGPITVDGFLDSLMAFLGAGCAARLENLLEVTDIRQVAAVGGRIGAIEVNPFVQASMAGGPAGVVAAPLFTVRGARRSGKGLVFQPCALRVRLTSDHPLFG